MYVARAIRSHRMMMSIFSIRSWLFFFFLLMTIVSSSYLNKIRPLIGCLLPLLRLSGEAAAGRRRVAALPVPGRAPPAAGHRRRPARRARQWQAALRAPAAAPARRAAGRRHLRQPRQVPRRRRADGRAHLQRLRPREGNRAASSSFLVDAAAFSLLPSRLTRPCRRFIDPTVRPGGAVGRRYLRSCFEGPVRVAPRRRPPRLFLPHQV